MDIDAGQYASMSRQMANTNSYLQVYDLDIEYLDKPPFLFWVSSLFMKIFGANQFAYKLPSFLFSLLAVYATYGFAKIFYKKEVAILAATIFATCQGFFLMNHDVRTDTILCSTIIFTSWQLAKWFKNNCWQSLILAFVGMGIGLLTKGPIAVIVQILAFGSHFLFARQFYNFFRWQYLIGLVIIGLLLFPMMIGLYQQFDMHPEKIVNGTKGVSGLRFYFWTQSFGRITGESQWNNGAGIGFLYQNMLWSFLPWVILFTIAIIKQLWQFFANKCRVVPGSEVISLFGFVLTYLALGKSHYQLPHYIFAVFPFAAVITARYFHQLMEAPGSWLKRLTWVHVIIFCLLWIAAYMLAFYVFADMRLIAKLLLLFYSLIFIFAVYRYFSNRYGLLILSLITIIGLNLFLNLGFYPRLLQYQAGSNIGNYITRNYIKDTAYVYNLPYMRSFSFYGNGFYKAIDTTALLKKGDYIVTDEQAVKQLMMKYPQSKILYTSQNFPVTKLNLKFLNPNTREQTLVPYFLIQLR